MVSQKGKAPKNKSDQERRDKKLVQDKISEMRLAEITSGKKYRVDKKH